MTDKRPLRDAELDSLFSAARATAPTPSDDLMARIIADAADVTATTDAPLVAAVTPGLLGGLLAAIGGWPALAGLATATVVGVALGLTATEKLDELTEGYFVAAAGYQLEDLMPSYGDLLGEG